MERELFRIARAELRRIGRRRTARRQIHTDATIVEVYFWGVLHDRSINWACQLENWVGVTRRMKLPSQSAMSRRLRTDAMQCLIDTIERRLRSAKQQMPIVFVIDGKVMQVGPHSRDPDATWGRVSGGKAKGYKLHLLMVGDGTMIAHHVAPLNVDERVIAVILLEKAKCAGYVLADANYDTSRLHDLTISGGGQLVSPRAKGRQGKGLGNHYQSPGRLRSIAMLENDASTFGNDLYKERTAIERKFGYLVSTPGLLAPRSSPCPAGCEHFGACECGSRPNSSWPTSEQTSNAKQGKVLHKPRKRGLSEANSSDTTQRWRRSRRT